MFHADTATLKVKNTLTATDCHVPTIADPMAACDAAPKAPKVNAPHTADEFRTGTDTDSVLRHACGLSMSCTLNAMAAEAEKNKAWRDEFHKFAAWRFYAVAGYVVALSSLMSFLTAI